MQATRHIILGAVLLGLCCAADWPQWRGPERDGVARDARLPHAWPKQSPRPVWKVAIGEGYSGPAIARGRLFIMGRQGNEERCLCFDVNTGKELWRHAYAQPFETHPGAKSAGIGPKSTPTIDGDRVYMLGIDGRFHCFDVATGRVHWSHDFATEYWGVEKDKEGYEAWKPFCGMAASPLIDGDRVIVPVGGKKGGAIAAFDKNTGKLLWKCLEDRSSYASPMVATLAGVRQIVGFTGKRMIGAAASDGRLLWEYPFEVPYDDTIVTPVIRDDLVMVCGWDKPATALRITARDGKVEATPAWQNKSLRSMVASPVYFDGHLYGFSDTGRIICIDMADGKTRWTSNVVGSFVTIVVANGQVLALNEAGVLHVMDASPKEFVSHGKLTLSDAGETWAHLAVIGDRIYVKDKEHLFCLAFGDKP